ncbi:Mitochondrial nicotinamide adenine dinucleotide transporter 2 [Golovinomyces cichoracearum]|uniref:Mitochondrial nicotinamide adenine dinucleotide transporter 2 n=1 Tax=Golovinomyces cichoracearum TaxID=62708 RepID=A0A420J043_9PEZI|nr:Mitochondrial nicotinamide adenine dinucleotide transporter 2 [Golovinomyces cichoracearum]
MSNSRLIHGSGALPTPLESWAMRRGDDTFNVIAGSLGGFMSGLVTCPLDVIKTKLQAQGGFRIQNKNGITSNIVYRGMIGTAGVIWQQEGLKGMYRGLGPIILGYLPTWAVWFTLYGRSKQFLGRHIESQNIVNIWSSIVAGACSSIFTNPIWVIKTRLMSQVSQKALGNNARPPWYYKSTFDAARKMYRTEGLRSFYSGLIPALFGLTHVAIQIPAYEVLKIKFTGRGMGESSGDDDFKHYSGVVLASFLSKLLASSATYPHEVLRTRLQTQQRSFGYTNTRPLTLENGQSTSKNNPSSASKFQRYEGISTTIRTILREEGWKAFYAGMGTSMMRAIPAATTTLVTFEYAMKHLRAAKEEGEQKSLNMYKLD